MKKYFVISIAVLSCLLLLLSCTSPPLDVRVTHASFTEEPTNTPRVSEPSNIPEVTATNELANTSSPEPAASLSPDILKPSSYTLPLKTSKPIVEESGEAGRGQINIDLGSGGDYLVHFTQEGDGLLKVETQGSYDLIFNSSPSLDLDSLWMHDAYGMIDVLDDSPHFPSILYYEASGDWTVSIVKAETTTEDTNFYGNGSLITPVFNIEGSVKWRFVHKGAGKFIVYFASPGKENVCISECVVDSSGEYDEMRATLSGYGLFVIDAEGEWEIIKQ